MTSVEKLKENNWQIKCKNFREIYDMLKIFREHISDDHIKISWSKGYFYKRDNRDIQFGLYSAGLESKYKASDFMTIKEETYAIY